MAIKIQGSIVIDDNKNFLSNTISASEVTASSLNIKTGGATIAGNVEANSYKGKLQNLGSISGIHTIDLTNGDNITMTLTGATTINVSGVKEAAVNTFTLIITNPGLYSITILNGILTWDKGLTPVMPSNGKTVLVFETYDSGSTWIGAQVWRYPA